MTNGKMLRSSQTSNMRKYMMFYGFVIFLIFFLSQYIIKINISLLLGVI